MKIFIDKIDSASILEIGFAKYPSFLIHFRASAFSGGARFVPASDRPEDCEGHEFEVEIAQESISEFCVTKPTKTTSIEALGMAGSYRVHGTVSFYITTIESIANPSIKITAGEAIFILSLNDMGGVRLDVGTSVSFIVHDLSFWDEAL
jgi:hypothetical protein